MDQAPKGQFEAKEFIDKFFSPKERNFKCPQQPGIMQLFFDNNLNHMKELEVLEAT